MYGPPSGTLLEPVTSCSGEAATGARCVAPVATPALYRCVGTKRVSET